MKYLIFVLLFLFCGKDSSVRPLTEEEVIINFEVYAGSKYIEDERIVIKNQLYIIEDGFLPMHLSYFLNDTLIAEFEAKVSNFSSNHPQCDCELIGYNHYRCTEEFIVNGNDWELAK